MIKDWCMLPDSYHNSLQIWVIILFSINLRTIVTKKNTTAIHFRYPLNIIIPYPFYIKAISTQMSRNPHNPPGFPIAAASKVPKV